MANRLDPGFMKADSSNLPEIDVFMVAEYVKNCDFFNQAEVRNVKLQRKEYNFYALLINKLQSNVFKLKYILL